MIQKDTDIPMSMAALFTTAKTWKPICATIDELIKEKWCVCVCVCVCVYTYTMEYYSVIKRMI